MATKSVIDIEIHDEAFKEFAALFEKYQSQLGKMPGQWGKVGSATQQSAKGFDSAVKNLVQAATAMSNIYAAQTKVSAEQSKINKIAKDTQRTFENIGKTTANIGKSVASTTLNLLRWSGIGLAAGLLGGAGGLFGLTSFAANIGDLRRQSQGLGVSSAELRAARVGYGRYADVDPLLGSLSAAQTDVTKQWAFGANRLNPNQSAAELLPQLLRRAGEVYKQGPAATAQQRLQAQGLDVLGITVETARRMAQITEKEQKDAEEKYQRDLKSFDVIDETLKKWQEFSVTINEAGEKIKTTFINGLAPLAEPLSHLADSFSDLVASFLKNPDLPKWINVFGQKIEEFAKYLGGDQIKKDVDKFIENVSAMAETMQGFLEFVGKFMPSKSATQENREYYKPGGEADQLELLKNKQKDQSGSWLRYFWNPSGNQSNAATLAERNNNPGNLRFIGQPGAVKGEGGFAKFATQQEGFLAMANQLKSYGAGTSAAAGYKKLQTLEEIISTWAPPNENNTEAYINFISKKTGIGRNQQIDMSDPKTLSDIMAAMAWLEKGGPSASSEEIQNYLQSGTKVSPAPSGSSAAPQKTGMLNWNPTPIALNVTTTKIPGQDTMVNMLAAGGYYTGLGVS